MKIQTFQRLAVSLVLAGLSACAGPTVPDEQLAEQALVEFFADLHAGRYAQAAEAYGGSYEVMIDHNPALDPADHAALFRSACTINGAQCLEVLRVELLPTTAAQEFHFEVVFRLEDGSPFVLGPCCGGFETDFPPVSAFTYTLSKGGDGRFRVMDMPVYVP
jgi:hypothetical protein